MGHSIGCKEQRSHISKATRMQQKGVCYPCCDWQDLVTWGMGDGSAAERAGKPRHRQERAGVAHHREDFNVTRKSGTWAGREVILER